MERRRLREGRTTWSGENGPGDVFHNVGIRSDLAGDDRGTRDGSSVALDRPSRPPATRGRQPRARDADHDEGRRHARSFQLRLPPPARVAWPADRVVIGTRAAAWTGGI